MIQIRILYIVLIAIGIQLFAHGNNEISFGQYSQLNANDTKLKINSLNLTEPIYQAMTGEFLATRNLSSTPFPVTAESFFEESVMSNVGNVTNNMTFINTYLPNGLIQAKGNGTIETENGQTIDWISSDVGIINSKGPYFYGIILFNNTNSEKLSFLSNTTGFYKESPDIKRTMWLIK
jgi:hypothetical protein